MPGGEYGYGSGGDGAFELLGGTAVDLGTVLLGVGADASGTDISSNGAQTVGGLDFTTYGTSGSNILNVNNVGPGWTSGSGVSYLTLDASLWPGADFTKRIAVIVKVDRGTAGASGEIFAYLCGDSGLLQRTGAGRLNSTMRASVLVNGGLTVDDEALADDEAIEAFGWVSDLRSSVAFHWPAGAPVGGIYTGTYSTCIHHTAGALPGTDSVMLGMLGGNSRGERFVSVRLIQLEA